MVGSIFLQRKIVQKERREKVQKAKKIISILFIALLIIAGIFLIVSYKGQKQVIDDRKDETKENIAIVEELESLFNEGVHNKDNKNAKKIDFLKFSQELLKRLNEKYNTDKIVAYLDTGKEGIQEIVAFNSNSDFYDRRNINGDYDFSGTVFLYKENEGLDDPYLNLFGHSMKDKTRLGKLLDYQTDLDLIKNAKLYTEFGTYEYELTHIIHTNSVWYDKYPTWEKDGFLEFIADSKSEGKVQKELYPLNEEAKYMLLNTCFDDLGDEKLIAVYELKTIKK